jgi:hypothetical protein
MRFMTLFYLRVIASDIEHEFFEKSLRLNSVTVMELILQQIMKISPIATDAKKSATTAEK